MHSEFEFLTKFFKNNGFPDNLISNQIKKFLDKVLYPVQAVSYNVPKKSLYISIPYFGLQSDSLRKELLNLLNHSYPYINFKIILTNSFSISSFFKFKDRLPDFMSSNLVYFYRCGRCAQSSYVGSTHRTLKTRLDEHVGRSSRTNRPLQCPPFSAIRNHCDSCSGELVESKDFKILSYCNNPSDLKILESMYINKLSPDLNNMLSSYKLNIIK